MSKEYIERKAVVVFLENMAASRYLIQCFEDKEKFPAANVVPVVHGKWMLIGADDNDMPIYRCSVCGTKRFGRDYYCGHCGTKMGNKRPQVENEV